MVTTDAVGHRHPELARYAKLALSHAIIVGEPIKPSILFQDQDGEIHLSEARAEVGISEIGLRAFMFASDFGASATVSFFPQVIDCDGEGVETIVIVTHDHLEREVTFYYCVVREDEASGEVEVFILDEHGLHEIARS